MRSLDLGIKYFRVIEGDDVEEILKLLVSLLDLNSMPSGKHELGFNLVNKTGMLYLLLLARGLITVDINTIKDDSSQLDLSNSDPLQVYKDSKDDPFFPTYIEKGRVFSKIKFYSDLLTGINKNYQADLVYSKAIKIILSLIQGNSLIRTYVKTRHNGSSRTSTFYKFKGSKDSSVSYNISIVGRVDLRSNMHPFKISNGYGYSKSYASFHMCAKPKKTQHKINSFDFQAIEKVTSTPIYLKITGKELFDVLGEFDPHLKQIDFLKSLGDMSLLPTDVLRDTIERVELLLHKIYNELREKVKDESVFTESKKIAMDKSLAIKRRKKLLEYCLSGPELGDKEYTQPAKNTYISILDDLKIDEDDDVSCKELPDDQFIVGESWLKMPQ